MRTLAKIVLMISLSLLVASRAEATPIELDLAITYNTSVPGLEAGFNYYFFQRPTYDWPATPVSFIGDALRGSGTLLPGETHFIVSLDFPDLSQAYFAGWGSYYLGIPGLCCGSNIFVAQGPNFGASAQDAYTYGPIWISLADLGSGLSGRLEMINGVRDVLTEKSWEITPVPEPATIILFGTGLAAAVWRRKKRA